MIKLDIRPTHDLTTHDAWARKRELEGNLSKIVETLWPHETHRTLSKKLRELDKAGEITLKNAAKCWSTDSRSLLTGKNKSTQTALITHYIFAAVYISRINPSSVATDNASLFMHTAYHVGALEWHIAEIEIQKKFTARAKTGGKAKSLITDTVREKIKELLLDKPSKGWPSIEKTAELLRPKTENYIEENRLSEYITTPFDFIKRELSKGETKEIYKQYSEKNISGHGN